MDVRPTVPGGWNVFCHLSLRLVPIVLSMTAPAGGIPAMLLAFEPCQNNSKLFDCDRVIAVGNRSGSALRSLGARPQSVFFHGISANLDSLLPLAVIISQLIRIRWSFYNWGEE